MKKVSEYSGKTIKYGNLKTQFMEVKAEPAKCFKCEFLFRSGNYFIEVELTDPIKMKIALCGRCFRQWKEGKFLI